MTDDAAAPAADHDPEGEGPALAQLQQRVHDHRYHLNRHLDALANEATALELALAELQAHPDWSR